MKKLLLVLAIAAFTIPTTFAQSENSDAAYSKGSSTLSAGYVVGNIWKRLFKISAAFSGGTQKVSSTGPFTLTYEYGVSEHISAGLALGYNQVKSTDTDGSFSSTETLTNMQAVARANYHFGTSAKFDPYAGIGLGYYHFKYEYKDSDGDNSNNMFPIPGAFGFSGQLGAKYYVANNFGLFAEVGYVAGGYGQVGITAKF